MSSPSPSDGAELSSVEGFLRTVLRSGLLDQKQLVEALRDAPPDQLVEPHRIAEHLIHKGKLSRFQARKLLKGRSQGLLLGPFQVLALIGKGGIGTVYLVRDQRSNQLAALKILSPQRARDGDRMRARFQREMSLCRRVSHPHIARTFEVGEWKDICYIAMEFIPGKSLSRVVADEGPLPVPRAARLIAEVAAGLTHAHAQGLVHRDLKPSNILVTPHDHAKILDLGLAILEGEEVTDPTVTGGQGYIVGTMDYIAPEQTVDAAGVDARADIYSLGCTMYYVLVGHPPFPGGTKKEKILRHRNETPTSLSTLRPNLPSAFVELVERMMARDPAQRPATARAVEQELARWAKEEEPQPLDRAEDETYSRAIAALSDAEPPSNYSWNDLPTSLSTEESFHQYRNPGEDPEAEHRGLLYLGLGLAAIILILTGVVLLVALMGGL